MGETVKVKGQKRKETTGKEEKGEERKKNDRE
jgi:hypothetical protein